MVSHKVIGGRLFRKYGVLSMAAVAAAMSLQAASAGTFTWNTDTAASWGASTSWDAAGVPTNLAGDTINLTFNITAARAITLNGDYTMGFLNIGDSATAFFGYTINPGTPATSKLILNSGGAVGGAQINQNATSGANTIAVPILIDDTKLTISNAHTSSAFTTSAAAVITSVSNADVVFSANAGGALTINGLVNNTGTITNSGVGAGAVTLVGGVGANVTAIVQSSVTSALSITGPVTVGTGGLTFSRDTGAAALTVNASSLTCTVGRTLDIVGFDMTFAQIMGSGLITNTSNTPQTLTVSNGNSDFAGIISGNIALNKTGGGVLGLINTNTFTGGVTLSGGTVGVSSWDNIGKNQVMFSGGILQIRDTSLTNVDSWIANPNTFNGGFDIADKNNNFTVDVALGGTGGLTKNGAGNLILSQANTYTGATTVNMGTLTLDFSNSGVPAGNIINNTALVMGDSTLRVIGGTTDVSQSFTSTSFGSVQAGQAVIDAGTTHGHNLVVNLGTLSRTAGSTAMFILPSGPQSSANGITTSTTFVAGDGNVLVSAASNGVAYATVGKNDWASVDNGNIKPLASYANNYGSATNNVDIGVSDAPASAFTVNTLRFNNTAGATTGSTLTLPTDGPNIVNTGGVLITSNVTSATALTITGGTLAPNSTANELVFINNGQGPGATLTIDASVALGVSTVSTNTTYGDYVTNNTRLTFSGPGTTVINAVLPYSNSYNASGVLQPAATGAMVIEGGATVVITSNNPYRNGGVSVIDSTLVLAQPVGTGTAYGLNGTNLSFSLNNSTLEISGANTSLLTGGGTDLTISNGVVINAHGTSTSVLPLTNNGLKGSGGLTITGTQSVQIQGNNGASFSGGLIVEGSANLYLNGASMTYTGGTTIYENGRITLTSGGIIPVGSDVTINDSGILDLNNGGSSTTSVTIGNLNGGSGAIIGRSGNNGTSTLTIQAGNYAGSIKNIGGQNNTITNIIKDGDGTLTLSGAIGGSYGSVTAAVVNSVSITKNGSGTLVISASNNSYTGATTVNDGVFQLDGSVSVTPTPQILGPTVVTVNGGTLQITSDLSIGVKGTGAAGTGAAGTLTVLGGGTLSLTDGTINTLTLNNNAAGATVLTLGGTAGSASILNMDIGSGGMDLVTASQGIVINSGGVVLNLSMFGGSSAAGNYDFLTTTGTGSTITNNGTITFANGLPETTIGNKTYTIEWDSTNQNRYYLTVADNSSGMTYGNSGDGKVFGSSPATSVVSGMAGFNKAVSTLDSSYTPAGTGDGQGAAMLGTTAIVWSNTLTTADTVDMQWRARATEAGFNEVYPNGDTPLFPSVGGGLLSDVVQIDGTSGAFVLEMSYDATIDLKLGDTPQIACLEGGIWTSIGDKDSFTNETLEQFLTDNGSDLSSWLGTWGVEGGMVWAVVGSDGVYAVVPEPTSLALLGLGAVGLLARRRK